MFWAKSLAGLCLSDLRLHSGHTGAIIPTEASRMSTDLSAGAQALSGGQWRVAQWCGAPRLGPCPPVALRRRCGSGTRRLSLLQVVPWGSAPPWPLEGQPSVACAAQYCSC